MSDHILYELIGQADDKIIQQVSGEYKPLYRRKAFVSAVAALVVIALGVGFAFPTLIDKTPVFETPPVLETSDDKHIVELPSVAPILPEESTPLSDTVVLKAEQSILPVSTGNSIQSTGDKYSEVWSEPSGPNFSPYGMFMVVKVKEVLPDVYHSLVKYDETSYTQYHILRVEVLDPLDSGAEGEFWIALYKYYETTLQEYDQLLISAEFLSYDYVLKNTRDGSLYSFSNMFFFANSPAEGNVIPFYNGVFTDTLWQKERWSSGYVGMALYEGYNYDDFFLADHGDTLEDVLGKLKSRQSENPKYSPMEVPNRYTTDEGKALEEYVKPFENGVFIREGIRNAYGYRRYINGCPTNEVIKIHPETEEVTYPDFKFTALEINSLPDLGSIVENINSDDYSPPHIADTSDKKLQYYCIKGWYEKNENGTFAIVKMAWQYWYEDSDTGRDYLVYDESFYLVTDDGMASVSREELIELIGKNSNIHTGEYGALEDYIYE